MYKTVYGKVKLNVKMQKKRKKNPPQSAGLAKYLLTAHLWIDPHLSERIMQNAESKTGSGQDLK